MTNYTFNHAGGYSAIFIDIENIYYYLKNSGVADPDTVVYELIRRTRNWLQQNRQEPSSASSKRSLSSAPLLTPGTKGTFQPPTTIDDPDTRRCLYILVNEYGMFSEIWLTPFLRRLNEEFPLLANHERRALIANLVAAGAIRVERREGNPYPYSVAIINWDHPTVHEVNEPQT
ncbi:MAG: hypothetical protein ACP5RN_03425 [Armatimonadota bacterium]